MPKAKAAWSVDEKTERYKAKVQVWEDGPAEYTLSRRAAKGVWILSWDGRHRGSLSGRGSTSEASQESCHLKCGGFFGD